MQKKIILKPCPHCGGSAGLKYNEYYAEKCYVYCECQICGSRTGGAKATMPRDSKNFWEANESAVESASVAWNSRVNQTDIPDSNMSELKNILRTIYQDVVKPLKKLTDDVKLIKQHLDIE